MVAMLAHSLLALSLVVHLYDAFGVPGDHLDRARMNVDRILKDAGVTVVWRQCPCPAPVGTGQLVELVVRIIASSPSTEPASLGFSYVDVRHKSGTLATVFPDRVRALAAAADQDDDGQLLGRAIAHELTHLLVGTRDHDLHGLMRGRWTTRELARQQPSDWLLSGAERAEIREAIARRAIESTRPALVTAGAHPASDVSAQ
jgi:hypothetical protein